MVSIAIRLNNTVIERPQTSGLGHQKQPTVKITDKFTKINRQLEFPN